MSMNDSSLDRLLRSIRVPEREPAFWKEFPRRVSRRLCQPQPPIPLVKRPAPSFLRLPCLLAWKLAGAAIVTVMGVSLGMGLKSWWESDSKVLARQMAPMRVFLRECKALFPHQIRAIVFKGSEVRLLLAESEEVPDSSPILLQVRSSTECQRYITFSGQIIQLDGERCEVLRNAQGDVLVVGKDSVWSSAQPSSRFGTYRVSAKVLEAS